MSETVYFPSLVAQTILMQNGEMPKVFASLGFCEFKQTLDAINVAFGFAVPKHIHGSLKKKIQDTECSIIRIAMEP
jgi:hypothetical protein